MQIFGFKVLSFFCYFFFLVLFDEDNHSFTGVSTAEKNMRKKRKVFKTSIQLILEIFLSIIKFENLIIKNSKERGNI